MTDLEAANRALMLLGVAPIGSLSDSHQAARVMNAQLPNAKRTVLNEFPFNFALRIEPLTPAGGSVAGYAHVFAKPSSALNVQRVYSNTDFRGVAEFRVVGNLIAANIEGGSVEYTAFVSDLNTWPQHVQECLVTRLASDAAVSLTGDGNLMQAMLQKYMTLASHAAEVSVVEENVPPMRRADYSPRGYVEARQ